MQIQPPNTKNWSNQIKDSSYRVTENAQTLEKALFYNPKVT